MTITKMVSVQIDEDAISIDQPEVWMKAVEEEVSAVLREAGREMMSEALNGIVRSKAPHKGIKEWAGKWVKTLWGDVRVLFPRPRARAFPKLRIPSLTPGLASVVLELCAMYPFRQVSYLISSLLGIRIPRTTLWREFQVQVASLPDLPGTDTCPAESVVIEADGASVSLQDGRRTEAKICLAFHERRDNKLLGKMVYASVKPAPSFNHHAATLIRRKYSLDIKTPGVVIGDGARWVESLRDEYFPQMRLQLDLSHVLRRARELLSHLSEEDREGVMREIILFIHRGDWRGFRDTMARAMKTSPRREAFWEWIAFLWPRWKHLTGFIGQPAPLSERTSSPCEKHVDLVINRRLNIPGASWSIRGAENMLKARNHLFNGGFRIQE